MISKTPNILCTVLLSSLCLGAPLLATAQTGTSPVQADLSERQIERLSSKLCRILSKFAQNQIDTIIGEEIENQLLKTSRINPNNIGYKLELANLWNNNSRKIICRANGNTAYPEQHFFNRVILQGFTMPVLNDYFFSDYNNFPIDPNVISINQYGQKETVLDYIDRILASPDAENSFNTLQIKEVRDIIETKFKGKRAEDL